MMTVILVILLLISLIIPIFTNVKMNAKTTLCKSQMRQIGVLITTYVADNRGYLPDDRREDYFRGGNNELYENWNSHLLPYACPRITSYTECLKLVSTGDVWIYGNVNPPYSSSPANPLTDGWVVVKDAYLKGGFDELKVFICPEIHK